MVVYWLVRTVIGLFKYIPFNVINRISGGLSFVFENIIQYRKKVLYNNLQQCFPHFTDSDLKTTKHRIYSNLSDILLEGIKGLTLTREEILSRNQFFNIELVNQYLEKKQSVICVCPHYYNWEWTVLATGYNFPDKSVGIYKKINNSGLNKYITSLRAKSSMYLLSTRETRMINELIPKGKLILLMSDQNPSNIKDAIWVKFFNKETACLHGLEKYAKQYNLPIIYMDQNKIGPSRYSVSLSMLVENPESLGPGEITQIFMSKVESIVRAKPWPWLWTHKRWKHKRASK